MKRKGYEVRDAKCARAKCFVPFGGNGRKICRQYELGKCPPKDRPILFSAPMIKAILEGRKTQTRRLVRVPGEFCRFGAPGDLLWVKTSRYMPRVKSAITLEVLGISRENLKEIGDEDARAEGVGSVEDFAALWDTLHKDVGTGWDDNPEVWVLKFMKIEERFGI